MFRAFEWLAALFVVVGVALMIFGHAWGGIGYVIAYLLGVVCLTTGVRLAIDTAKADR